MPLIKSHTDEAREKNIDEMIRAGHEPEQAVAASYANQRKYKKMAEGGEVGEMDTIEHDPNPRNIVELNEDAEVNRMEPDEGVDDNHLLAKALAHKEDNYADGGFVEEDPSVDEDLAEPEEVRENETMDKALSEEQRIAIMNAKKKRNFLRPISA